jgi:hypothetical protein
MFVIDYYASVKWYGVFDTVEIQSAESVEDAKVQANIKAIAKFKRNHPHVADEPEIQILTIKEKNGTKQNAI